MAIDINIPSQVKNYANLAAFPATGSLKTIYIAEDKNKTYRWTGSAYVEISASQAASWGSITGTLSSQTDLQNALNAKQDSLGFTPVPTSRTLTINGTTQDLSADRTFTISTGITIGTTAITSGTVGRVLFEGTGNVVQESANLFWDNTNGRLGIGTSSPAYKLSVSGSIDGGVNLIGNIGQNQGIQGLGGSGEFRFVNGGGMGWFFTWVQNGSEKMRLTTSNNLLINTTTDAGFKLDVNGTVRVSGNTVVTTWLGVGGVTTPTGSGEKFNVQGAQVISGASGAGNFLLYQISGASRFIVGSEASIGGTANNYINYVYGNNSYITYTNNVARLSVTGGGNVLIGTTTDVASSKLTIESTTQGVLFPRMTTTQVNAIATPAEGLVVYNTTISHLCVYQAGAWVKLSHSPM